MSARENISVSRTYNPTPDACVRALHILLNQPVIKMADKLAPEPVGRDDARESNGCTAYPNNNR